MQSCKKVWYAHQLKENLGKLNQKEMENLKLCSVSFSIIHKLSSGIHAHHNLPKTVLIRY